MQEQSSGPDRSEAGSPPPESVEDIMLKAMQLLRAMPAVPDTEVTEGEASPHPPKARPRPPSPPVDDETSIEPAVMRIPAARVTALPVHRTRLISGVVAIVLGVVALFAWIRALNTSPKAPNVSPDVANAGIRWAMTLQGERIEDYRRRNHRVPIELTEIGYPGPESIQYQRLSETDYRLSALGAGGPLVLESTGSRAEFLGNSMKFLGGVSMDVQ